ncbi:MAG TPA: bifunctional UDP-N-acetylglucosamine diphosphorylase/glucosamine-1-phosphate N-acetyltransferase GlmU [Thermoanaerobaculia bacterium]|nr:bifunctional UDP-N-acetylglucosamine diphosphorylase/glucosamine-1-phosphate N-acetyltransferase GlmU [Thermoanaerobaculia bacterium]
MADSSLDVVILAAGLGTRMKSATIKILHSAGGRPLIDHVLELAAGVSARTPVMVIGHQRDAVQKHCGERARYAVQEQQLGTGHAVLQAVELIEREGALPEKVLVLSGDVPLTRAETLRYLIDEHSRSGNGVTILSMELSDPALYGRVIRNGAGGVSHIVEAGDASEEQKKISEVNGGIYVFEADILFSGLRRLSTNNAQGEYYLTDLIAMAEKDGRGVGAVIVKDPVEALGVNSRSELSLVETELKRRHVEHLMKEGVTFRDPLNVMIDSTVSIGADTIIYPFVTIEGASSIGKGCILDPGVHLESVTLGDDVHVKTGTVAEGAIVASGSVVGPYAHLRPGTVLGKNVKVGNFVETKKAVFGEGSKASHLSYIGDAEIGTGVNIGAGTITCNYDGVNKNKTVLEDGVFIGSDTQLVAPVTVGKGAYVGAGSTITKDVPADALALSRTQQKNIDGWATRRREEIAAKKKK